MLDPKLLRNSPDIVNRALKKRGFETDLSIWQKLENSRKGLQADTEKMQASLNKISKEIGKLKNTKKDSSKREKEASALTKDIKGNSSNLDSILQELNKFSLGIPNIPDLDVPEGNTEKDNKEIRSWGKIPEFSFEIRDHLEIGQLIGGIDMEAGSRVTGSRFSVLKSDLAGLHRALIQFMLETHICQHGYQEVYVPYIVNKDSLLGTGQLPKFEEDLFKLQGDQNYYLSSTAEIPVTNLLRDQIIDSKELPVKWVSHTPCFRSEAGSYGKDTRGLMRVHQFEKVELFQAVEGNSSEEALEEITSHAEAIMQSLEIPYRVVSLCSGDLGFSAAKTYDIEAWIPSQSKYREISSCSNFRDFQSRRMQARWKNVDQKKNELLHTLNGSGLAVGRTLLAILELNQLEDGSVKLPKVLKNYFPKDAISVD
ncbi:MAG: serine--tRNA ligase [SAR86 cluster bacterium]|nr:serine--tRNA ligase [SAR86 cluster bacterium]